MRSLLASILVAGLLLATGCSHGGDPPAVADPTRTPATSPSIRTGPVAPALPAVARRPTKAGAIAFAKYYWAVVDYAQKTGDTHLLRRIANKTCRACDGGADWIDKIHKRGGIIHGGSHTVRSADAQSAPTSAVKGSAFVVSLTVESAPDRVTGAGNLNSRDRGGPESLLMTVQWFSTWEINSWLRPG